MPRPVEPRATETIKRAAFDSHFRLREKEVRLAQPFGEAFRITHASTINDYSYWLVDPKPHIRDRLGIRKEVLVVYSPFRQTDARVLNTIRSLGNTTALNDRIADHIAIVIHSGTDAQGKTIAESKFDRSVIVFHERELLDAREGPLFVQSRMVEQLGATDLFSMSSPIKSDEYFFGRDELVQQLINRSTIRRDSSGLFGLRKTGKTSVLYAVQRRLRGKPFLTEYIDCQSPGIHGARWWSALESITERLAQGLKQEFKRDAKAKLNYTAQDGSAKFSHDIRAILANGDIDGLLLLLDEIEWITPQLAGALGQHWDDDFLPFWQTIRAVHQETQGRLSFVVAGVNPAAVAKGHFLRFQNPIFQMAQAHYLSPLSESTVGKMVTWIGRAAGMQFSPKTFAYLCEQFGGHPYLIRLACSEVWGHCDTTNPNRLAFVDDALFRTHRAAINDRLAVPIKDILLSLVWWYPDEYDLLQILAEGEPGFLESYADEHPGVVSQFADYGVLTSGEVDFAIKPMQDFLRRFGDEYKTEISPFTRSDFPPDLLPEIPDKKVLGELFDLRTELEIKLRRLILMILQIRCGFDATQVALAMVGGLKRKPGRANPGELFQGRRPQDVINDLYIPDLTDMVLYKWEDFRGVFDNMKERFRMNMDTVNIARRPEAHAKPVSQEDVELFKNSYRWLMARIGKADVT